VAHADEYDRRYKKGVALFKKEDYGNAVEAFKKAYELKQKPGVLLSLGQCYRKMGEAQTALEYYERYLQVEPNPPEEIRSDVFEFIARTKAMAAPLPEVKPSPPVVVAPPPPPPPPEKKPFYKKPWFWGIVGGVAAVGIGVGIGVGVARSRAIPSGIEIVQF
jgi:tetratricopeptide (TPR) repeat protein